MRTIVFTILLCLPAVATATAPTADTGPWWLGHLVTLVGIVIGAAMIIFQLGRQHANESERLNENFRGQLRLQIYQEFSPRLSTASDAACAAGYYAASSHTHSAIFAAQVAQGIQPQPISARSQDLLEKHSAAANEAVEVVFLVEKYSIVHPDFDVFKIAISSAVHDLHACFDALFAFMLIHFPVESQSSSGIQTVDNVKALDAKELATLNKLAYAYQGAAIDISCYHTDMRVELQRLLLGHLFPNTIPRRHPADPTKKVITLDPASVKSLRRHFLKNTEWGRKEVASRLESHHEHHG